MSKFGKDGSFNKNTFRANFKNVIAKRSDLVELSGQRLKAPDPGEDDALVEATYPAGTVLGVVTATGRYTPYDDEAEDGSDVAKGVLRDDATIDSDDDGTSIAVIKTGTLFKDLLIGLDANAITDMRGLEYAEGGSNLIKIG